MSQPSRSHVSVEGPVALVTGAGRRLGNGIARDLAARGYRVAAHANESRQETEQTVRDLTASGAEAIAVVADLRDEAAVRAMVAEVVDQFGRVDALVNNAAIWISKPLPFVTADDVRQHFEVNTLGTFLCCQEVGLRMAAQEGGGAIVNIGDWAIARPYLDYAAYFPSKGSIPALTRMFAVELGTRNPRVRVNAVLPGPVLLPAEMSAEERHKIIDATLVKREGSIADVAQAVAFLLSSTFITGVCLPVDGGRTVYAPPPAD